MYIIYFDKNWADEFDCQQFALTECPQYWIDEIIEEGMTYFGSNEGWELEEISEDDFVVRELSKKEWDVMVKLFPTKVFGTGLL